MFVQLATFAILHDKVRVCRRVKRRKERRHKRVVNLVQNCRLCVQSIELIAVDNFLLGQNF